VHGWLLDSLDALATFQNSLNFAQGEGNRRTIFKASREAIRRLIDLPVVAFLTVDSDGLNFSMGDCDPENERPFIEAELEQLIHEGSFSWVLNQNHVSMFPARTAGRTLLLHVLASQSRTMGMFVGVIDGQRSSIPVTHQKLLSVVLLQCAGALRIDDLYSALTRHSNDLKAAVDEQTRELRESEKKERQANRAKSDFLATMSHEIRTPMNGVLGMAQVLADTQLDEDQRKAVGMIQNSGKALLAIINDILDFSKIESGQLKIECVPFDFWECSQEIIGFLEQAAEAKGIALRYERDEALPRWLMGDPTRIQQVLFNLAGNAIKFTKQGHVTLRFGCEKCSEQRTRLLVEVEDTGIGIPAEALERIFDRFTQADSSTTREFGGSGLGLSISRKLVEQMGGTISVRSRLGEGSVFSFNLTLLLGKGEEDLAAVEASLETPITARVLVAEDNAVNQIVARRLLEKLGCCVEVAENGLEALEILCRSRFDLVFMDCHMPKMSGFEATIEIRNREAEFGRIPIVALTANAMQSDAEQCLAVGMNDFISKPVKREELRRVLMRWLSCR
jgi:signal transduction histidine kinase/CheY-like chemotaxis protein